MPSVVTNNPSNPQANIAQFNSPSNPLTLTDYDGFTEVKQPYAEEWNFGIQQEIAKGIDRRRELRRVSRRAHGGESADQLPTVQSHARRRAGER